jgi:hypothetical protein
MRALISSIAMIGVGGAVGADETRGLGAHEHGTESLTMAFEGDRIAVDLEAPGFDIVGLEHTPESDEDQAAIETARTQLQRPEELFRFSEAAACNVIEAAVEQFGKDNHEGDGHAADGHEEARADTHEVENHEDGGRHTEFHARYTFICGDPVSLSAIEFPYFDRFPNAEKLEVQMAAEAGAISVAVERDAPSLDLSGMM